MRSRGLGCRGAADFCADTGREAARSALRSCELCELRCGVDRTRQGRGTCLLGDRTHVFRCYVSYAEELDLIPALMIYLGGCNFRCRFCTQAPQCFRPHHGPELLEEETLAGIRNVAGAVPWINLLGGEPSLHPHAVLALREQIQSSARWILNTNGYFTAECMALIDSAIDLYLVDLKFGSNACAQRLAGVPRYTETLGRNLQALFASGAERLLVRHLVMPGHLACCTIPVARQVARLLPGVRFHLMGSYVPSYRALRNVTLGRAVGLDDLERAQDECRALGLNLVE